VCSVPLSCHRAFTLVRGYGGHGVPSLGLRDVHAAAYIVYGRAQRPGTRGGDHNDEDSQRDNQQFEAVNATHQSIAAERAQNPPSGDVLEGLHDHSLVQTERSPSGDRCVGCGVVVGDPEFVGQPLHGGDAAASLVDLEGQRDFADAMHQRPGGHPRHQDHHGDVP
jgi:hypothetical protein